MAHARTTGSLPVPNVQALAETCSRSDEPAPERYIRPEACSDEVIAGADPTATGTPIIDLGRLLDPLSSDEECAKLGSACHHWGIFQLVNHGVPEEVIRDMKNDMAEFFRLPLEAKKAYSQIPGSLEGYGQAFVVSEEQKLDWADMFYLVLRPTESRDMRFWPAHPPSFRFSSETAKVARCLLEFTAKDMGVEPEALLEPFHGQPQGVRMNYYPPCQQADQVLGLSPHTDTTGLTVLLQASDVQGLQIRTENGGGAVGWLPVHALDGALIVNIGDILEIMSNGRYKSVEHRAVIHPSKERISAAANHRPRQDAMVGPLAELVGKDADGKARYRSMNCLDFMKHAFSHSNGKKPLESLRI